MGRVTLKTVATELGVSAATVSNAYNRPDQLSPELRLAVLAKAAELGYSGPDAAARALRRGRTNAVGVVLTERLSYAFSDPYAIGFLTGLTQILEQARISVTLLPIGQDHGEIDLTAVREASVDALTGLCLPDDHPAFVLARARGLPVAVTHVSADPDVSFVAIDDVRAGELVGQHLAELGHQRIGVIVDSFPLADAPLRELEPGEVTCIDCQARLRGLRAALPDAELTIVSGGHNAEVSGRRAVAYLLDLDQRLTAVVAMSDVLGLGVLDEVREHGLDVPADLAVAGFDDIPAAGARGLTTVRQPIQAKGRLIAELLLDPERADRRITLDAELVVRSSTGPPASTDHR